MALLVPMSRRTSRKGLVDALSAHYGSPGRLADYRRQFEKTTRSAGDDPSIFAIALETLAVKAFGDMGQILRLIRDRFIAGHSSCELRRYLQLDSVPPETPIRDVVDRCRVWENHADPEIRQTDRYFIFKFHSIKFFEIQFTIMYTICVRNLRDQDSLSCLPLGPTIKE